MTEFPWKKAIIVGGSGGIGSEMAQVLRQDGCDVALVGRDTEKLGKAAVRAGLESDRVFEFDVTEFANVQDAFDAIVQRLGGLDLIVYAAGAMPLVGPTEYDIEKDRLIIDTNLTAAIAWCNVAAKRFERAGGGTILAIGSPSGDRGRRGNPAYGASKAGLEAYLESLRNRLSTKKVSVVTAKPGPVNTPMTEPLGKLPGMIDAGVAARMILRRARKFGRTFYVPSKWWLVTRIMRLIPSSVFRRLKI